MLDACPDVRYKEVTAAYMSNEAVMLQIARVMTSILRSLKRRYQKVSGRIVDQVRSNQSQFGKRGAQRTNLSRRNLPIVLGVGRSITW